MREILFRGKQVDTGKWEYGSFVMDAREQMSGICGGVDGFIRRYNCDTHHMDTCEVDRDTIGQYTGLTDKNGKRIFEGDIVKYTFDMPDDPNATENGKRVRIGRIFFSDWRASFSVTAGRNCSSSMNNNLFSYVRNGNRVEVIGNIHDNPELLKEA